MYAQEGRFSDVEQTKGKEVYVLDNSAAGVAYVLVDGKVKPVSKVKNADVNMSGRTFSVEDEAYTFKNVRYIVLKDAGQIVLLKEDDSPLYLSSFVSRTYWQEKYDSYRDGYAYMDFRKIGNAHSSEAVIYYDDLTRIVWQGMELSEEGASFYMSEWDGAGTIGKFRVTSSEFEELKDNVFIKKNDIQPYVDRYNIRLAKEKRDKEIADSLANSKLRLAISLEECSYAVEERVITVHENDTLAVFSYKPTDDQFVVRYHFANLLFDPEDIEFLDSRTTTTPGQYSWDRKTVKTSEDAEFLKAQGEAGREQRFDVAKEYDDVQTRIWFDKTTAAIEEYKKDLADKKQKQIFITGLGYAYDDNEYSSAFGMYFDIFNCFSKTIKYVEFTMTNYNAVGDVQRDDLGRSSITVKGIGPIEPEEGGRYTWDDVFWDDRDVIFKTRPTGVKFIFTDGTTKVFSGYSNIQKHMTSDAWE